MTTRPLPAELREKIEKEAETYWMIKRYYDHHPRHYYTEGASQYASLWQDAEFRCKDLKDALERIEAALEAKNKAYNSILAGIPDRLNKAIEEGDDYEAKELKILSTIWGSSFREREGYAQIAREALSTFTEQKEKE